MYDNNHTEIGHQSQTKANAGDPIRLNSLLEDPLIVIPEHHKDYVQFALNSQAWPSDGDNDPNKVPRCEVGHWDEHISEYVRQLSLWSAMS